MPPRHGKSEMGSVALPTFYLGHYPDRNIIHCSHTSSLSVGFSKRARSIVRDSETYHQLFPHVALDPERQRVDDWYTNYGGGFKSIGVQGGITGLGADLLIIDDPVKEGDEQSPTKLQQIYDWYLSAARTRLSPHGAVVIIMTRWHPHDLAGRLLDLMEHEPQADQFEYLRIPALAEEDDPLGREPGEALWEERIPKHSLIAIQSLSEPYFDSLYQQRPRMETSPMFRREDFKRFDYERLRKTDQDSETVWGIDLAATKDDRSDYNVFVRAIKRGDKLRFYEAQRFRSEWPETRARLISLAKQYPDDHILFPKQFLEILALQEALDQIDTPYRIHQVPLPGDKISRAQSLSYLVRSGLAEFANHTNMDYLIEEHVAFPDLGQHDDTIDATSVITHYFGYPEAFKAVIVSQEVPHAFQILQSQLLEALGATS